MNMVGNIGAYLCPPQVGRLFDHVQQGSGGWNVILWLFAEVNAAGAVAWVFVNPRWTAAPCRIRMLPAVPKQDPA
jgi:hypothetical protein